MSWISFFRKARAVRRVRVHGGRRPPRCPAYRPQLEDLESRCFVARMLTVVQTRRLQGRSVLRYLYEALHAHRNDLPTPSLLSAQ